MTSPSANPFTSPDFAVVFEMGRLMGSIEAKTDQLLRAFGIDPATVTPEKTLMGPDADCSNPDCYLPEHAPFH